MRRRVFKNRDRKIFRMTHDRTKTINLWPVIMRGGYRL